MKRRMDPKMLRGLAATEPAIPTPEQVAAASTTWNHVDATVSAREGQLEVTRIRFVVHGTPVGKERARVVTRNGRTRGITPRRTREYERLVAFVARNALGSNAWNRTRRYAVTILCHYSDRRRRDLDNAIKAILDACNGVAWDDDSQVDQIHAYRTVAGTVPCVDVTVEVLP